MTSRWKIAVRAHALFTYVRTQWTRRSTDALLVARRVTAALRTIFAFSTTVVRSVPSTACTSLLRATCVSRRNWRWDVTLAVGSLALPYPQVALRSAPRSATFVHAIDRRKEIAMLVDTHVTKSPLIPDASFIIRTCHPVPEDFIFARGQQIYGQQGAPRVLDPVTDITRRAPAIIKRVASCVLANFFMFQPTARYAAKHSSTWDVTYAIGRVVILLCGLVTVNVRHGQTYRTFVLLFEQAVVAVKIADICAIGRMQIHVARTTTGVLASSRGRRTHRSSWTRSLAWVVQSHI